MRCGREAEPKIKSQQIILLLPQKRTLEGYSSRAYAKCVASVRRHLETDDPGVSGDIGDGSSSLA